MVAARDQALKPARGWLRAVREAIGLTQADVSLRMAVKRQSYAQFEAAEESESISIATLRRAATALDCDLVWFIVPRKSVARSYRDLAEFHDSATAQMRATDHSINLQGPGGAEE